ncbi:MAG: outer membrane protein assembly factor BamB [Verrucomicrobiales bacterium]|jgi:outer membrane protein assembly factor BamB
MRRFLIVTILLIAGGPALAEEVSFSRDVAPILQRECVACHREGKARGKYRLDSYKETMEAVEAGDIDESEIIYRITVDDEDDRMPVDAKPLDDADVRVIRQWVEQGAKYDAEDPLAPISAIIPVQPHPAAPPTYPRPVAVTAMAISSDGQELFSGGYHEILVWDAGEQILKRRIPKNGQRTYDLDLSPDGKFLAAATGAPGQAGELRVFDAQSGEVVATPVRVDDVALCVAFDPTGARMAFGASDGKLRIIDTATWQQSMVLTAHSDWINALAWNRDGTQIATASRDKTAKVFEIGSSGKRLITFSGHGEAVRGVAFHPEGKEVISCGDHGRLLRWKIADGKKSADLADLGGPVLRLIASEAGYFATAAGRSVQFARTDQKRGRELKPGPTDATLGECVVHGTRLFVGTFAGQVIVFDLESGEQIGNFLAAPIIEPPRR